jgi:hypothetical protein
LPAWASVKAATIPSQNIAFAVFQGWCSFDPMRRVDGLAHRRQRYAWRSIRFLILAGIAAGQLLIFAGLIYGGF